MQANIKGDMSPKICTHFCIYSGREHGIKLRLTDQGKYQKVKVGIFLIYWQFWKNQNLQIRSHFFLVSQHVENSAWTQQICQHERYYCFKSLSVWFNPNYSQSSNVIWWSPMCKHFFAVCRNAVCIYPKLECSSLVLACRGNCKKTPTK